MTDDPDPDRPVLSEEEVEALVEVIRLHRVSSRNARTCTCGEHWKCARRRVAEGRLLAARCWEAVSRAVCPPLPAKQ
jgi:hypothetical protein